MIHGIGIDLVEIRRMEKSIARFGERLAGRILTGAELDEFRNSRRPAPFLAKRFAAKEAAVKALGTGFRGLAALHDIGVGHDDLGKPYLCYAPALQQQLQQQGISRSHLSITDEAGMALAWVLLEAD